MTADSDAEDASTAKMVSLAFEAGSNLLFFCLMTGVPFSTFSTFAALLRLPPTFNGCARLARSRAAPIALAFIALLLISV